MTKRNSGGEEKTLRCAEIFEFSKQAYDDVVPLADLIGCRSVLDVLQTEVGIPLRYPNFFELNGQGQLPANRFFRFYGVEGSSKRTAVLSFAMEHKIDVIVIRSSLGFKPAQHLPRIYEMFERFDKPGMILISNVEHLFFHEPAHILALHHCLRRVQESQYALWTVMTTKSNDTFPFAIDKFFVQKTQWSGLGHPHFDLCTPLERMKILSRCIAKFLPNPESFPWPENHELADFVEKYTKYCTYSQIEQFVRRVFDRKRKEQHGPMLMGSPIQLEQLLPSKDNFYNCLVISDGSSASISLYPARHENIELFFARPPE